MTRMRNGKSLIKLLTAILLIAPTIFFGSCATTRRLGADVSGTLAAIAPPMPAPPIVETVTFEDRDGGLWLSYADYRALERNVIALREYAAKLRLIVLFYRKD